MQDSNYRSPKELLQAASKLLMQEFEELRASNPHAGERGTEAEERLKAFLTQRIPKRFGVESGFVIGSAGEMSSQTDVIIYDAMNSPLYRAGNRSYIIPRDNAAAAIEVKSKLNKEELRDAATKLAKLKSIKSNPISSLDRPVTFSGLILSKPFTCVFAFDSYTSLDALAENLVEINREIDSRLWLDMVVVMSKGTLSYVAQMPFSPSKRMAFYGGHTSDGVMIPALYVHLVKTLGAELALNQFFIQLVSHLTFFRQRTSVDFEGVLGADPGQVMVVEGYQHRMDGTMVEAEASHQQQHFTYPSPRYLIYRRVDRTFIAQMCYWKWQDGAVLICSTHGDTPGHLVLKDFCSTIKADLNAMKLPDLPSVWVSNVLRLTEAEFHSAASKMRKEVFLVAHEDRDGMPDMVYKKKPPPRG
ncbi:MAG: 3-deoxy-7-phosphoheptulonate synthase [Watsoniomyces obsoletus]|nr:MAG: 3-deoxy-7-phosphoheptulonate synthase [Watsoniomyces obsoletus]